MSIVADETSTITDIKAPLWDDETYKAIIVPQTVAISFSIILESGAELSYQKGSVTFVGGSEYKAEILITADDIDVDLSGDIDDWTEGGTIPDAEKEEVSFEEFEGYFIYDGVTYNTITLSNGSTWMTENLAYLPEGYTPSEDPTVWSGVWYPYQLDYDQMVIDGTVALAPDSKYVVPVTDAEGIKSRGYLYDIEVALTGGTKISETNCYDFEGQQGICPPGWHIPTRAEYFDLVGLSNKNAFGETGNQTNTEALFYDESYGSAPIPKVNEGGFNYIFTGYRYAAGFEDNSISTTTRYQATMLQSSNTSVTEWYGEHALSYYMTSTCYQPNYSTSTGAWYNTQFFSVMSTFTSSLYPTGRLSLAYISAHSGQALRCVKDAE
ncbi:MAG: FISUMP domain-containing protein [Rikenellaceae bacterium]